MGSKVILFLSLVTFTQLYSDYKVLLSGQ